MATLTESMYYPLGQYMENLDVTRYQANEFLIDQIIVEP
jgi:hypothetical protein